jgi:YHS domain-containing protein
MISLKKSILQAAVAGIFSLSVFAQSETDSLKSNLPTHVPQKTCPVMGGDIDKSVYADYHGKRVYFCCGMCEDTFKKDPEKYIKKIEAMGQEIEIIASKSKEKQKTEQVKTDKNHVHSH